MRRTFLIRSLFLVFALLSFVPAGLHAEKMFTVYTVNYPLFYFAQRIGGGLINVVFPAPPEIDPAFWTPDESTVREYQQADLIILNGAEYGKWTKKVSLPMLRTVDTSRSFKDRLILIESAVTHSHGPTGDHSHGGTAFTTWLDFSQAALQAEAVSRALARKLPRHKVVFARNLAGLTKELMDLDKRMNELSSKNPDQLLAASHPIYQYFARRYALNLDMLKWEPDTDPGQAEWQLFEELQQKHPAKWMLWEGEPLSTSRERLQSMGVKSTVFAPCFSRPEQGDFLSVMQQNVQNMEKIFE